MSYRPGPSVRTIVITALVSLATTLGALPGQATAAITTSTPIPVVDQTEYAQALATFSADPNGPHTILLGENIKISSAADPTYTGDQDLVIDGQGEFGIGGQENSRVLVSTDGDALITFRDTAVVDGVATDSGGAIHGNATVRLERVRLEGNRVNGTGNVAGGGVFASFDVEIVDSVITDNRVHTTSGIASGGAAAAGGGNGGVTVERSLVVDNRAEGDTTGEGGAFDGEFDVVVTDSVLTDNTATGTTARAGALNTGDLDITGSHLARNRALGTTSGTGGMSYSQEATITNSSMVDNQADGSATRQAGLAIATSGISIINSTVTGNAGGGVSSVIYAPSESVELQHATIAPTAGVLGVAVNGGDLTSFASVVTGSGDNCSISTTASTYSYDDDGTCGFIDATDTTNGSDPLLGPGRDNGDLPADAEAGGDGTVRPTMFPLNGSPLVNRIPVGIYTQFPALVTDQRGLARPFGTSSDIGAIEAGFPAHDRTDVTAFYDPTVRWITSAVNDPQILSGFDDGTFGQTLNITRGQVVRMYHRAAGAPTGFGPHGFDDVIPFFEDAVRWAKAEGVFDGFDDGTFRHGDAISRGNFTRSLHKATGETDVAGLVPNTFSDVTDFYDRAVTWATANGLADGFDDDTYRQSDNITRGNAGRIFYNTAQSPDAWDVPGTAPANMLFRPNLTA